MKKFIGYYIIGANNKKDAQDEKGLLVWSTVKPSLLRRFFSQTLLGIYWIDKTRVLNDRGKTAQSENSQTQLRKLTLTKGTNSSTKKN